jgi:hypothetical protein
VCVSIQVCLEARADSSELTLEKALGYDQALIVYQWLRTDDEQELYNSILAMRVRANAVELFNTYKSHPLGKLSRCGGLGCDLEVGSSVGKVNAVFQGRQIVIINATGQASFLMGATCTVKKELMNKLVCRHTATPANVKMDSLYILAPSAG